MGQQRQGSDASASHWSPRGKNMGEVGNSSSCGVDVSIRTDDVTVPVGGMA